MNKIDKIRRFLPADNSAALITSSVNRRYFSSFLSSSGAVLITKTTAYLLVDFRYIQAARRAVSEGIRVVEYKKLFDSLNEIIKAEKVKSILIEEKAVTLFELDAFKTRINAEIVTDKKLSEEISKIRMIKTDDEIENIIKAQKITEKSYNEILSLIKPGVSEREIALSLEYRMKKNGAERVAFDLITITGNNTSLPHGVPSDREIKNGDFFTMDIGAVYNGYHSDMTRTVAVGFADDKMREIYSIVLNAHKAAFEKIKPQNTCCDVDTAAREVIEKAGYGKYFGHSTGHSVGLEIHEPPTVYMTDKTVLQKNMIITDEPGIYIENEFGVRIEDMVLVTENGAKSLADVDKELIII